MVDNTINNAIVVAGYFALRSTRRASRWRALCGLLAAYCPLAHATEAAMADDAEMPELIIYGTTPVGAGPLAPTQVPGNVQTLSSERLTTQQAPNLAEVLNAQLGSVNLNDTQGSGWQVDLNYRGFTASPVLGTPQGLAVQVDGARVNEVFGDTVNWDLIPEAALANALLTPGSNPVFGLGSTGGTLALNTKSGFQFPGTVLEASTGSHGRSSLVAQTGGHGERVDYFTSLSGEADNGWADHNAGHVIQWFTKAGYTYAGTDMDISFTRADAHLAGSQTLPRSWLNTPSQSYTWPDTTHDTMNFLNLQFRRELVRGWSMSGNLHERQVNSAGVNSNVNGEFATNSPVGSGNEPTGNARSSSYQARSGATLELSRASWAARGGNTLTFGLNAERGVSDYAQFLQSAGSLRDTRSDAAALLQVRLRTQSTDLGVYATDTASVSARTFVTVAARYDDAATHLMDQLGSALNGRHGTARINPSAGLTFNPTALQTWWVSYGEGMRLPTPVELTCANPSAPCTLPNAFASDPALRPVRSQTAELGVRSSGAHERGWSIALFRATLQDDIEFISSGGGASGVGYFANVGRTQRQGLELGALWPLGAMAMRAHYSYIEATYQSSALFNSPDNSSSLPLSCATCTDVQVTPGRRIPGIPAHNARLSIEYSPRDALLLALDIQGQSSVYARGDENNQDVNGPLPGFLVLGLRARRQMNPHWQLFANVSNLLNRRYSTFGVLGENEFTAPGRQFDSSGSSWRAEQFRSVSAPFGVWLGLRFRAGGAPGTN